MRNTILVLNGPSINWLGKRQLGIYGAKTLQDIEDDYRKAGEEWGLSVEFRQSNHEVVLVDWLHEAEERALGVVLNLGAYGHTSIALYDAIRAISVPVVEVHISNYLCPRGILP